MDCNNAKTRRDGDYFELQVLFYFFKILVLHLLF